MNKQIRKLRSLLMIAALLVMAGSIGRVHATVLTNTILQTFDAGGNATPFAGSGSVAGWLYWYSIYGNIGITNDPAMDAGGDAASGSLLVDLPFGASGNQQAFFGSFHNQYGYDFTDTANALNYTNITFDIRVAAGQKPTAGGTFGSIGVGFYNTGTWTNLTIPGIASNGWVHMTAQIDKTRSGVDSAAAFMFYYSSYSGYPTNRMTFWMDNVALNKGGAPPAPPTVSLEKPVFGLNIIDVGGGVNDRESIMSTTTSGNSWVGQGATPVTYSFTVTNFPDSATYQGFAAYFFLIPGPYGAAGAQAAPYANIPSYETAPDYNETNVVFLDLENGTFNTTNNSVITTNRGAVARFRYKVNTPNNNSMIYGNAPYTNAPGSGSANFGSGALGSVTSPSALGTWSMTFVNDTNITLTSPSGNTSTFTIPEADAIVFSDAAGFTVLLGSQPNSSGAIGQKVVYSRVRIQGTPNPLDDNFLADSALDTTNSWTVLASAPKGIVLVPTNTAYWINWTVPDVGYSLQSSASLLGAWTDSTLPSSGQIGSMKKTLLPTSSLPSTTTGFFRLVKRTFTQLQVLFPGETNAPNTLTGKGGTPTPVNAGDLVTVTVNAVDSTWHVINGVTDTVTLSTTDSSAFLPNPAALANGTQQMSIIFNSGGSWTVTAADTTDNTKTSNTSSPITVNSGS